MQKEIPDNQLMLCSSFSCATVAWSMLCSSNHYTGLLHSTEIDVHVVCTEVTIINLLL